MRKCQFCFDYDLIVKLFTESRDNALPKLLEEMLNQLLLAESSEQLGAESYERSDSRQDYRNGLRTRYLTTRIGNLELRVLRHRDKPFKTMLFENYQRSEQALVNTMAEMVVMGVSTRKIQKITEDLCGKSFSKSTVSEFCKTLDEPVKQFRQRLLKDEYPFIIIDAMYIKVREEGRVVSKAVFIAVGISKTGNKEILGFDVYNSESRNSWKNFLESLKSRGLRGVQIITSDANKAIIDAVSESFPKASWQRCQAHLMRNILDECPKKYRDELTCKLREMFNTRTIEDARAYVERFTTDTL